MKRSSNLKSRLMSGTFLVLATTLISGCGAMDLGHTWGDLLGDTRTLPDDDVVDFNNRHTPVLNPATNRPMPSASDMNSTPASAQTSQTIAPMPSPAPAQIPMPPYTAPTAFVPAPGRHVPIENQSHIMQGAAMSAPVTPVASSPANTQMVATPGVSSDSGSSFPARKPVNSSMQSDNAVPAPVARGDVDLSAGAPPTLASVPQVPAVPAKDQTMAQYNALTGDRANSDSDRRQLLNNSNATVMTSPATGQLVDNAATAAVPASPPAPDSNTAASSIAETPGAPIASPRQTASAAPAAQQPKDGFGLWLHTLFHKDATPAAGAAHADAPHSLIAATTPDGAPVPGGGPSLAGGNAGSVPDNAGTPPSDLSPPKTLSSDQAPPSTMPGAEAAFAPVSIGSGALDKSASVSPSAQSPDNAPMAAPPMPAQLPGSADAAAPVSPMPVGTALPQPGASPSVDAMVPPSPLPPAGTEVAPNVILGAAPAFPPAPEVSNASIDAAGHDTTFAQPVPPASLAGTPPTAAPEAAAQPAPASPPAPEVASTPAPVLPDTGTAQTPSAPSAMSTASASMPVTAPEPAPSTTAAVPSAPITPQAAVDASMQPGASTAQDSHTLEPVTLTPPHAGNANLPDVSQVSSGREEPVNLVPPSESTSSSQATTVLPDSRYAGRRSNSSNTDN